MLKQILYFSLPLLLLIQCSNGQPSTKAMDNQNPTQQKGNPYYSRTDTSKLILSEEEWKKVLSPEVFYIARQKGTEYAFTGKYWDFEDKGTYYCAACGNKLFRSDAKFASSCGWPSFFVAERPEAVLYKPDYTHGMIRTEVLCGRCDGHLGHIFDDGPAPTFKRFCMNSVVLDFEPDSGRN